DRRVRIHLLQAGQSEDAFAAVIVLEPIKRRFPAFLLHARPTVRKPELGAAIAAIGDEIPILAIAHRARSDAEGAQQLLVARTFIVEGKVLTFMTYQRQAAGMFNPFHR